MITSFRSKALRKFAGTGDTSKLSVQNTTRLSMIMNVLDAATKPDDMNVPGLKFHALQGDKKGRYSVWVTGNWRITFGWDENDAIDVDLEDYH